MSLQERHNVERKRYMDGEISHHDFYRWLGNQIEVTEDDLSLAIKERLPYSTDEYLNDIRLQLWDALDPIVRRKAHRAGMRIWSYSDTVCVMKALAKEIKGE